MTISKRVAKFMLFGGLIGAALIYLALFNSLSETEMVNLSYIWLPISVAGAAILYTGKNTLMFAIICLIMTVLALFVFFELIFPAL